MNKTSLAITALVIVAATAIGFYGFAATQSAAAQALVPAPRLMTPTPQNNAFNTDNSASQTASQTGTATGGDGGFSIGGSANGGSATVDQSICQQAAQSGAFGTSNNTISTGSCD
jgi:hypothetical protein